MSDQALSTVRERARTNLFWRHLGIEVDDAKRGLGAAARIDLRDPLRNAPGAPVHGGVYSALVDTAVGGALSHDAQRRRRAGWARPRWTSTRELPRLRRPR